MIRGAPMGGGRGVDRGRGCGATRIWLLGAPSLQPHVTSVDRVLKNQGIYTSSLRIPCPLPEASHWQASSQTPWAVSTR